MTLTSRGDPAQAFGARLSRATGDDPIGSARIVKRSLFIEAPFPRPQPFAEAGCADSPKEERRSEVASLKRIE